MTWYLVKTNWPRTEARCPGFAGLGGDVWPLDSVQTGDASTAHSEMERARTPVRLERSTELLCQDRALATRYATLCASLLPGQPAPLLLEVGLATDRTGDWDGFDVGSASGGYSLIQSEVLHGGRPAQLNRFGLFPSLSDVASYLNQREASDLEEVDGLDSRDKSQGT